LPKKFKIYPKEDCTPLYDRFLERAQNANVAIELNTAGLRKDCREIYPSRALLEIAARRRVPITFGSDAHAPEEVGMDFAAALELAKSVGYTHRCRFEKRRRTDVAI
jgi:histidinol-phosphatase (PHP family)